MRQTVRRLLAEALGTMFLLIAVVGSGIMGERLAGGDAAVALLANSIATGGALIALIATFGPISGAHFNPVVTALEFAQGRICRRTLLAYIPVQMVAAIMGVIVAHAMFDLPLLQSSSHARNTPGEFLGEVVATFGLLLTIWGVARTRPESTPYAVAAYITGAYWFTSSTSFANPAVTIARSLTDTFAGIAPASISIFVIGQVMGLLLALLAILYLNESNDERSDQRTRDTARSARDRLGAGADANPRVGIDLLPSGCTRRTDSI